MQARPFSSVSPRPEAPCLEVADVTFLANGPYTFTLGAGECVGLRGRSGIGKTQLLRAIADLIPHGGSVRLHGVTSESVPAPQWRRMVGLVPADSGWWHDRVGDHFLVEKPEERLRPVLARLGFDLDVLTWEVSRLSMGERQRLALVRALLVEPQVVLLDEPSSALDDYYTRQMEMLIEELRRTRGLGVVWVGHDPEQLRRVTDRIFTVEQHGICADSSDGDV